MHFRPLLPLRRDRHPVHVGRPNLGERVAIPYGLFDPASLTW